MSRRRIRVLASAFAAVPGASPQGASMMSMVDGLRADLDLVTVKTEDLAHTKRMGDARMFRVPVGSADLSAQRDAYARAVRRQLEAEPYQVVHVFDPWAGAVAAEHRAPGRRLVYEIADFPEHADAEGWISAHRATLSAADRIWVPTMAMGAALGEQGLADKIDVVRPGVDVSRFDWVEPTPRGTPRLLYLGGFGPGRDLETLLLAIEKVTSLRPVRVMIAGDRDRGRRDALREQVRDLGLADTITVRGEPHPRRIPELIGGADVCVVPALGAAIEGLVELPQPLLEPLSCARPVVAADVPGISELVRDEVEGLLHPPGNATALADALLEVMRDSVLRERLIRGGYRRVRDELTAGARRRTVRRLYEGLAPGSQGADAWEESFDEITGLFELSTGALELLREGPDTLAPPDIDTDETRAPGAADEKTRPRAERPRDTDTHPGLVVPDTDPGRG
ncbi:MAG: glycosyltransferase family 4 protein [Myxococcota bacterium]|nr:glycosyltransferase family 4 protein [Myxococcota bacterium]